MDGPLNEPLINNADDLSSVQIDFEEIFNSDYSSEKHTTQTYYTNHIKSLERLATILRSTLLKGFDVANKEDMAWRERQYGNNQFKVKGEMKLFHHIINCCRDPTIIILLCASFISLVVGIVKDGIATGWIEGIAILFALILVISITSSLNYSKQQQFERLNKELRLKMVRVIRSGEEKQISLEEVLVGDIMKIKPGDIIEVDGILIGRGKIEMDESAFSGKSTLVNKISFWDLKEDKVNYKATPIVLSGSEVVNGNGSMIVCAIGSNTFEYRNQSSKNSNEAKTKNKEKNTQSLQNQLNNLASNIESFAYFISLLIGGTMVAKAMLIRYSLGLPLFDAEGIGALVNALIIAITILVVAVPEGLPMASTIALAYSIHKLKKDKCLIKNIEASEVLGNINNIVTDKTGVMTYGELEVISCWIGRKMILFPSQASKLTKNMIEVIFKCIYKNNSIVKSVNENGSTALIGDKTEQALFRFLKRYDLTSVKAKGKVVGDIVLPFSSDNRYMISLYSVKEEYVLFVKGAPEDIGLFFSQTHDPDGILTQYEDIKEDLMDHQKTYAKRGIRSLSFGYKMLAKEEVKAALVKYSEKGIDFFKALAKEMTFAFMLGLKDMPRIEITKELECCKLAGLTIRMTTGDDIDNALAIGKQIELIDPFKANEIKHTAEAFKSFYSINKDASNDRNADIKAIDVKTISPIALEGEQFCIASGGYQREYNEFTQETTYHLKDREKFKRITSQLSIIAKATADDKFLLVLGLKELNNIVAVTGDKTVDSLAFSQANVSFAMGIQGTDLAKRSSDIILLDDSFSSIVSACQYGRNVYDCIRKFIQFQLTTNVVAVFITLLGVIVLKTSPLNAIQLLWINVIMDSFASLSLATDSQTTLQDRKPYKKGEELLTTMMLISIISQAIYQIIILLVLMLYGDVLFNVPSDRNLDYFESTDLNGYHFTLVFNAFVFMQVFNSLNARKVLKTQLNVFSHFFDNFYYLFIQLITVVGQIALVSFGGRAVRTHPLSISQHLICAAIGASTLLIGFIVKLIPFEMNEMIETADGRFKKGDYSFGYRSRGSKANYYEGKLKSL